MNEIDLCEAINIDIDFGNGAIPVGRLAMRDRKIYFEYDSSFIGSGLKISPFHLPLKHGVSSYGTDLFEGLPGVFNDSLPDGWGRLLFDRLARSKGILPINITPLDRLSHVGTHGLGTLIYRPDRSTKERCDEIILDQLARQTQQVLNDRAEDALQELLVLNGSLAGARPKILIGLDDARKHIVHGVHDLPKGYTPWIVKFDGDQDSSDSGAIEYVYALMAKEAGINMPDTHLFPAQHSAGYFAIKRFDRNEKGRLHMHTACGLLHSDFRTPSLDYEDLIALTSTLTRDVREVEKMFRLAVFNVLAHNRDDHSKNFSFLMDAKGEWQLSPAYDLTFSSGSNNEQSTTVMGEGRNPTTEHLTKLGSESGLSKERISKIIDQTRSALAKWRKLAKEHGVDKSNVDLIGEKLEK